MKERHDFACSEEIETSQTKMGDYVLQQRILKLLSSKPKKCESTNKIVQSLHVTKKELNAQLYDLKKKGSLIKQKESPPVWKLNLKGEADQLSVSACRSSSRLTRTQLDRKKTFKNRNLDESNVICESIQEYLKKCKSPSKTIDIAKAIGFSRAKEINPSLHKLYEQGIVKKMGTKPPKWQIKIDKDCSRGETSGETSCKNELSNEGHGIQEALFPMESTAEEMEETNDSEMIPEVKTTNPFRAMFRLDDPISDDGSSTGTTSPDKEENIEDKEDDMEETIKEPLQSLKMEDNSAMEETASGNDSPWNPTSEYGSTRSPSSPIVKVEPSVNSNTDNSRLDVDECSDTKYKSQSLSEDEIIILSTLNSLPGVTHFVLKKKVSSSSLDDLMSSLTSKGLVTGSSRLWTITQSGREFMLQRTNIGADVDSSSSSQDSAAFTKPKPKFSGIPPPPSVLLNSGFQQANRQDPQQSNYLSKKSLSLSSPFSQPSAVSSCDPPFKGQLPSTCGIMVSPKADPFKSTSGFSSANKSCASQGRKDETAFSLSSLIQTSATNKSSMMLSSVPTTALKPSVATRLICSFIQSGQEKLWEPGSYETNTGSNTRSERAVTLPKPVEKILPSKIIPEPPAKHEELPEKYANYPNQGKSFQCFKSLTSREGKRSETVKSAFSKAKPLSPMEIIQSFQQHILASPEQDSDVSMPSESYKTTTKQSYDTRATEQTFPTTSSIPRPPREMLMSRPESFSGKGSNSNQFAVGTTSVTLAPSSLSSTQQLMAQNSKVMGMQLALSSESFAALGKSPVSALMEYAQSRKMEARVEVIKQWGSSHKPTFEMAAFVGKRKFPSIKCHNKKEGRKEASDVAMRILTAEGQFQAEAAVSSSESPRSVISLDNMTHFDKIAALTHRGFNALVSQITGESFAGRKVIAGLVMKRSESDIGVLVSLGTGNRCITGQQLSLQGNTVNDSHAEIITRRGFIRFLYKQLLEMDPTKPSPLFEQVHSGKLRIRPNITFHLYISTAPCGDGALFSPRDGECQKAPVNTEERPVHEPTFTSNVQGLLRTKVEGGEGTIPVEAGFKGQTFDGIQRGERLLTMSCSDKVCRWNVVGMQGALLSHFLEPVYMDSLTLGLLYDPGHLSRAMCCRVGRGDTDINNCLPTSYALNHPWLGRVTVCEPSREIQKTKALSLNWCFGDSGPEVTDGTLGTCYTTIEKGFFSRCSKRNLFLSFKAVCEKFGRQDLLSAKNYREAKMLATDFQEAKDKMLAKFKENGYGKWVEKPVEEEMFSWEES